MPILIRGQSFDTMKEACNRLEISRQTMLRYFEDGFFTPPKTHPQGQGKRVRYFDADWYAENEKRLKEAREKNALPETKKATQDSESSS